MEKRGARGRAGARGREGGRAEKRGREIDTDREIEIRESILFANYAKILRIFVVLYLQKKDATTNFR